MSQLEELADFLLVRLLFQGDEVAVVGEIQFRVRLRRPTLLFLARRQSWSVRVGPVSIMLFEHHFLRPSRES